MKCKVSDFAITRNTVARCCRLCGSPNEYKSQFQEKYHKPQTTAIGGSHFANRLESSFYELKAFFCKSWREGKGECNIIAFTLTVQFTIHPLKGMHTPILLSPILSSPFIFPFFFLLFRFAFIQHFDGFKFNQKL